MPYHTLSLVHSGALKRSERTENWSLTFQLVKSISHIRNKLLGCSGGEKRDTGQRSQLIAGAASCSWQRINPVLALFQKKKFTLVGGNSCHVSYFGHFPSSLVKECQVWTYFPPHLAELFITGSIAYLPHHPGIPTSLLLVKSPYLFFSSNATIISQFAYKSDTKNRLLAFAKHGSPVKLFEASAYKTPDCHPAVLCPWCRSGPFTHQHHFRLAF